MNITIDNIIIVNGEEDRDLSKFLMLPDEEEERCCYKVFYDAMLNRVIHSWHFSAIFHSIFQPFS